MRAAQRYYTEVQDILSNLYESQMENVEAAAEICANSIANGGLVFLFGAGHSSMMCDEMTPRQGGFVGFFPLVEGSITNYHNIIGSNGLRPTLVLEQVSGLAEQILSGFKFGPHDAFIIISTSGIRPIIVEMAMGAKERGMPVIAVVSRTHCEQSPPNHPSGTKLIDHADVVLDNHAPRGDCAVGIDGLDWKTGPVSTITGAMCINLLRCEVAERLLARGHTPVMLPSHQWVENANADEQLEDFYEAYRKSLAHLYR